MEVTADIIYQQAEEAIKELGVEDSVSAERVADSVMRQAAYWETPMRSGEKLIFLRFFSPVVQREEVFLGNVLFNDFLSKAFARTVANGKYNKAKLVANDLESYYFLLRTSHSVEQIGGEFRAEVKRSLSELFFSEQDEGKGIYGSVENMLNFVKADVEPFPVFVMPQVYAKDLERAVRQSLLQKIEKSVLDRNPTSITANLAFFYSHNGTEMQSPPKFLGRLAFQYKVMSSEQLETSLNIPGTAQNELETLIEKESLLDKPHKEALSALIQYVNDNFSTPYCLGWFELFLAKTDKGAWKLDVGKKQDQKPVGRFLKEAGSMSSEKVFDEIVVKAVVADRLSNIDVCSKSNLRKVLKKAVRSLGEKAESDPDAWLTPYIQAKFLSRNEEELTDLLLSGSSIGYNTPNLFGSAVGVGCRFCGIRPNEAEDKNILVGQSNHKFHNHSSKQKNKEEPKACVRCSACVYLMIKLIGSESVGKPQVPKTYNLIFHYGRHDDDEVERITRTIDRVWDLLHERREAGNIRREANKQIREAKEKLERAKNEQKKLELEDEIARNRAQREQAEAAISETDDKTLELLPFMKDWDSPNPAENPSLDVWANSQLSESRVERHVLGLGMGGYRVILFVLPQISAPYEKEHDFAQRRFSYSRVMVTALLSFLRQLCGCDGPFYYQSLPTLAPETFKPGTFYVRNQPISVSEAQTEYEAVTQLAWRLVQQSGSDGFVRKLILAEKLMKDPLGTFSAVMRDTAILGRGKGRYKQLPGEYRKEWGMHDLTGYAKFIRQLSKLEEVKRHGDQR